MEIEREFKRFKKGGKPVDVVFSDWVGVCKMHYLSSRDEFQCITDKNLTSIFPGDIFFLPIIMLILPMLQLPSEINDPRFIFFVAQDANSFSKFLCNKLLLKVLNRLKKRRWWCGFGNCSNKIQWEFIANPLSVVAEIVGLIPRQNWSVFKSGRKGKSRSSERDT